MELHTQKQKQRIERRMHNAAQLLEQARTNSKTYSNMWNSLENQFLAILKDEALSELRYELTVVNYERRQFNVDRQGPTLGKYATRIAYLFRQEQKAQKHFTANTDFVLLPLGLVSGHETVLNRIADGVLDQTVEQVDEILPENQAVKKFVSYTLRIAKVKDPDRNKKKQPRIVQEMQIAQGAFGVYADNKGNKVEITAGMNLDNLQPVTDQVLRHLGDLLDYNPFFRKTRFFDENLLSTRIMDTLTTVPAQYTLIVPKLVDRKNLAFDIPDKAKIMSKSLKTQDYKPRYFTTEASKTLLTVIKNYRATQSEPQFGNDLMTVANTTYFGNGCLEGQIGRIIKVETARNAVPTKPDIRYAFNYKAVNPVGWKHPTKRVIIQGKFGKSTIPDPRMCGPTEWYTLYSRQFEKGTGNYLPWTLNMQSSAGIWTSSATKKNSEIEPQTIQTVFHQLALQLLNTEKKFEDHPLAIQLLKPKAEVYDRVDFDTKTRNICALNAPVSYFLGCIHNPFFKSMPAYSKKDILFHTHAIPEGKYNLMGWSPVNGFFQDMFDKARKAPVGANYIAFYADNLYIASVREDGVAWVSLDGEKMECSHDYQDFQLYTSEILNEFDDVDPKVAEMYRVIATVSGVQAPVQLGRTLLKQKWLSSGVPGTADFNCMKMAQIVNITRVLFNLRYKEKTGLSSEEMDVIKNGLSFDPQTLIDDKRDLVAWWETDIIQKISRIMGVTLKEELKNECILKELERNRYVNLDFLGYGVSAPAALETIMKKQVIYPTLSRERLHKAMIYSKSEHGLKETALSKTLKECLVGVSKYLSLWLAGGWVDPTSRIVLPAMFQRDSLVINRSLSQIQANNHIAELLKDEGYSVPSDANLANGLFGFKALNDILLDETMLNLVDTKKSYLEPFIQEHFGLSNQDVPVELYKEISVALVPLLNEVNISTNANNSKELLGEPKTYSEQQLQYAIYEQARGLQVVERPVKNSTDKKEYQMLKITEKMYLKTFEFEKRKLAMAIVGNMSPMNFIIPHLYSLVTDEKIPLSEEQLEIAKKTKGLYECQRAMTALTHKGDSTFMPEPDRRVRMTTLVLEYFLRTYIQLTGRNIPVLRNALRRMPTVQTAENFMGLVLESLMQLPPGQMTGEQCTFTYMKLKVITSDDQTQWGEVPVNSAMKQAFFKIAVTQNLGVQQQQLKELNIGPYLKALYSGDKLPKTYTYALQITTKSTGFLNTLYRGLHGNGTTFFLSQIQNIAWSSINSPQKVEQIRGYIQNLGLLYKPRSYDEEQAQEIIASVQTALKARTGVVGKLRTIATTVSNIPPHPGLKKIYPMVATLMRSFINEELRPNDPSALYYAQVEQSYRIQRLNLFNYLNFDDKNRIRAWIAMDLAGKPHYALDKAKIKSRQNRVQPEGFISPFRDGRIKQRKIPEKEGDDDVHFEVDYQRGPALYEQYATDSSPQVMESINQTLDVIAQESEQKVKINAFFTLLNKITGLTISKKNNSGVMTMTVMDQWYAGSACINAYAYLARKYLGLRHLYIDIPMSPPPPPQDNMTPDFWILQPDEFKHRYPGKDLWIKTQKWYIENLHQLQNCRAMFEIQYMPQMTKQRTPLDIYVQMYKEEGEE